MGGKNSGRRPVFSDDKHIRLRTKQKKYDREIQTIMKARDCTYKEAQQERMKRIRKEVLQRTLEEAKRRVKELEAEEQKE